MGRHDSDSDRSPTPPRQRRESPGAAQIEATRRRRRDDSDSDRSPSPPRRSHGNASVRTDLGRHERSRLSDDHAAHRETSLSPERRRGNAASSSFLPTSRSSRKSFSSSPSPHHRRGAASLTDHGDDHDDDAAAAAAAAAADGDDDNDAERATALVAREMDHGKKTHGSKMSSGASAGLQTAAQVAADLQERKQAQEARFRAMAEEDTGQHAGTIYRDAMGRRMDPDAVRLEADREARKQKERDDMRRRETEWARGTRQKHKALADREEERRVGEGAFARTREDADLNYHQRQRRHWEDPMAATKASAKKQTATSSSAKPIYRGPAPQANRFNIPPGYRWDGVDRSNQFEDAYFRQQNEARALQQEAYKWSSADM